MALVLESLTRFTNYKSKRYQATTNIKGGILTAFAALLAFTTVVFMVNVLADVAGPPEKPALNLPELPRPISSPIHQN